jgi:hypothetical protein
LQISGCAPLQRLAPTAQTGGTHAPETHSCAVAQGDPLLSQAVRFVLQTCGCAPKQRVSPTPQVGGVHTPALALQSAAVAHMVGVSLWPFAEHL